MYGKDDPFEDPVLRCDSCGKLVYAPTVRQIGCCDGCGGRKMRNVKTFTSEEREKMVGWNVDPNFLALFENVEAKT